jgi:hypothetical protein
MKNLLIAIICCLSFVFAGVTFAGPAPSRHHTKHHVTKHHQHKKTKVHKHRHYYKPISTSIRGINTKTLW